MSSNGLFYLLFISSSKLASSLFTPVPLAAANVNNAIFERPGSAERSLSRPPDNQNELF